MVPEVGLEPTRREAGDFESPMYTNFITQAKTCKLYLALQRNLKHQISLQNQTNFIVL